MSESDGLKSERKDSEGFRFWGVTSHAPLTQGEAEEKEGLLRVNPPGLVLQQGRQ